MDEGLVLSGRYQLEHKLGRGGFGQVWLATDLHLQRQVAAKLLQIGDDEESADWAVRFRREAMMAAQITHPNLVAVYDHGEQGRLLYLVMELVSGITVEEFLNRGGVGVERTLMIGTQVCSALEAAHNAGVIHRDVKPGNVMLSTGGYVKVLDFGIAGFVQSLSTYTQLTRQGTVLGTLPYASPEQIEGARLDERTDLYSLGCLLYALLTGEPPFAADSALNLMYQHLGGVPVPIRQTQPRVPAALDDIVLKLLSKNRDDRYPDAATVRAQLEAVARANAITYLPSPPSTNVTYDASAGAPTPAGFPRAGGGYHQGSAAAAGLGDSGADAGTAAQPAAFGESTGGGPSWLPPSSTFSGEQRSRRPDEGTRPGGPSTGDRVGWQRFDTGDAVRRPVTGGTPSSPPRTGPLGRPAADTGAHARGQDSGSRARPDFDTGAHGQPGMSRAEAARAAGGDQVMSAAEADLRNRVAIIASLPDHREGLALLRQITTEMTHTLGSDHQLVLSTRRLVAERTGENGDAEQAAALLDLLVPDMERVLGPDHHDTLGVWHDYAFWTAQAGNTGKALRVFKRIVATHQRVLGQDHIETLTVRHDHAYWTGVSGNARKAMKLFSEVVDDHERILGPDHPDTLSSRHELARWTGEAGDPALAVRLLRRVVEDRTRVLGPDDPATLSSRHELGHWTGRSGRPAQAVEAYTALLSDHKRLLGADDPDTLAVTFNLAYWIGEAGDPQQASQIFRQLAFERERILGPDHPDTAASRRQYSYWKKRMNGGA